MTCEDVEKFLDDLDQYLSEHIIDPYKYDPKTEERSDLITRVQCNSDDNFKMLTRLRVLKGQEETLLISEVEAIKVIETFNIHTCGLFIRDIQYNKKILGHKIDEGVGKRLYELLTLKYQSSFPS